MHRRETELESQPPGHLRDRLIHLGHTASTEDEVMLTFRQGMQADVEAEAFRARPELDGLAGEQLVGALIDHHRRKAGQISVERIDPRIIHGHACAADPGLSKYFQQRPGKKRVAWTVPKPRFEPFELPHRPIDRTFFRSCRASADSPCAEMPLPCRAPSGCCSVPP